MFTGVDVGWRRCGLAVLVWRALLVGVSSAGVVFRDAPADAVLAAGTTAVLRCSVQAGGGDRDPVTWVHSESSRVLSKDGRVTAPAREKYAVVGDQEAHGEYNLRISGVQLTDGGEYRCVSGSEYRSAVLTVVVPPDSGYPLCHVQPNPTQQRPGGTAELSCTSKGGTPPAELIWHRVAEPISEVNTQHNAVQTGVTAEDNGVLFACLARSKAESMPVRRCVVMVLNVPPTGSVNPDLNVVRPGETATYTCTGAGIPRVTGYRWFVNFIDVTSAENRGRRYEVLDRNRTLRIADVQRWEDGAMIACEVSIASGLTGRAWSKLSVAAPPVTSANNAAHSDALFPADGDIPGGSDKRKTGPAGAKPQGHGANAGVVAGATMAAVGIILALVAIAILLMKIKASGHLSMGRAKKKRSPDKGDLPTGTTTKVDQCPIYAKPNKFRKGPAPAPPGAACDLATRKRQHSYEEVEVRGTASPGQTYTLPGRLEAPAPSPAHARRSDTFGCLKAQAPQPPPPPLTPLPPLPKRAPLPAAGRPAAGGDLLYADLDLPANTVNQSDYAVLHGRNSRSSGGYDWGTS